jgi:hypothetical protein
MARAVFGLPMYRSEALVGDVIESLLEQGTAYELHPEYLS